MLLNGVLPGYQPGYPNGNHFAIRQQVTTANEFETALINLKTCSIAAVFGCQSSPES